MRAMTSEFVAAILAVFIPAVDCCFNTIKGEAFVSYIGKRMVRVAKTAAIAAVGCCFNTTKGEAFVSYIGKRMVRYNLRSGHWVSVCPLSGVKRT